MDPFDELTRTGNDTSKNKPYHGSSPSAEAFKNAAADSGSSQRGKLTSPLGNPFVDIPFSSSNQAPSNKPVQSGAFQDLLPGQFAGVTWNTSPMNVADARPPMVSTKAASYPDLAPLAAGLQGWDAFGSPVTASSASTSSAPEVDGLTKAQVDALFQEADRNHDGRLIGNEAKDFFKRASITDDTCFMIWEKTKTLSPAPGEGLTRDQFSLALRLIAAAQVKKATPELLEQAANLQQWLRAYGSPLPAPRLQPLTATQPGRPADSRQQQVELPMSMPQQQQQLQQQKQQQQQRQPQRFEAASTGSAAQTQPWQDASSDPFASFQGHSLASAQQQQSQAQSLQFPQLQANPFDEASRYQFFRPQTGQSNSFPAQSPQHPDGFLQDATSQQSQDSHQSPLDDLLQPQRAQHSPHQTQSAPRPLPQPKSFPQRYSDTPNSQFAASSQPATHAASDLSFDAFGNNASGTSGLSVAANPFAQQSFGDLSLAQPNAPVLRVQKADMSPSGSPSSSPTKGDSKGQLEAPLAFDARLPPLHPKLSARLSLLAAAHGSLFAGPSSRGGLLQWARPEGNLRQPQPRNAAGDERGSTAVLAHAEDGKWTPGREDNDAAASLEVPIHDCKIATCMHVDEIGGILWTGHNDGKVCAFALDAKPGVALSGRLLNSWQAHRIGAVTVITTTPWGELWTGSSRGIIRVWRDAHKPGGESQRAVRELRRPGGGKPHGEVRSMTIPAGGQVVWTGGDKSTSIWCAHSGAFLGSIDRGREVGLPEASSFSRDAQPRALAGGEEWNTKVNTNKGLELDSYGKLAGRPRGNEAALYREEQESWGASSEKASHAFLENLAVTGAKAAGNAGKAAKYIGKLGFKLARNFKDEPKSLSTSSKAMLEEDVPTVNEGKKQHHLRALVSGNDGSVWVAFKAGRLERFRFNGKLLWTKETGVGIASMAAAGSNIWVGLADGRVRVYKDSGQQDFQAHDAGIIAIAPCGTRCFTLAADGSIKGWDALTPSHVDATARAAFDAKAGVLVSRKNLEMLCLTWNVNEQRPEGSALFNWIADLSAQASIAVIALQEIEMGGSSVAVAAAKDILNKSAQEKGNNNAQWWQAQVLATLGHDRWMRVGLRQLSGMLVMVFALSSLSAYVGEVSTASVACGVLGVGGNKGGVAVSFTLYRRRLCCVSSHFAAHQGAVDARNRDYANIVRSLNFVSKGWYDTQVLADEDADIRRKELTRLHESETGMDSPRAESELDLATSDFSVPELLQGQGMRDAEMLVWAGDFNYRIEVGYEDAMQHIRGNDLEYLLDRDQCRREMAAGRVFRYVREAPITFRPTYKFDKHVADPYGYDTSEKHRVPAWTDRIFFRGSAFIKNADDDASVRSVESEDPYMAPPEPPAPVNEVVVKAMRYASCIDVIDSDHKPVWALLALDVPVTDQEKKRRMCSHIMKQHAAQAQPSEQPSLQLSSDSVELSQDERKPSTIRLTNTGSQKATFCFLSQASRQWWGDPAQHDAGLPDWLDVYPVHGCIAPQESVTINLTAITNENVYTSQAMNAKLFIKAGNELVAGTEQRTRDNSEMIALQVACRRHF